LVRTCVREHAASHRDCGELEHRFLRVHPAGAGEPPRQYRAQPDAAQDPTGALTLTVSVPFAIFYMKQPIRLDFLWAAICLMGAVYFVFRT
jgi:hypothetical protein